MIELIRSDSSIDLKQALKGDKGDTPVKGVDYWTEEDKEEIRNDLYNIIL